MEDIADGERCSNKGNGARHRFPLAESLLCVVFTWGLRYHGIYEEQCSQGQ